MNSHQHPHSQEQEQAQAQRQIIYSIETTPATKPF